MKNRKGGPPALKQIVSFDGGQGLVIKPTPPEQASATDSVMRETFTIDLNAAPGKHTITATLKSGKKLTKIPEFFVQIPTTLKGAALQNTNPNLSTDTTGAAPLQTPTDGPVI